MSMAQSEGTPGSTQPKPLIVTVPRGVIRRSTEEVAQETNENVALVVNAADIKNANPSTTAGCNVSRVRHVYPERFTFSPASINRYHAETAPLRPPGWLYWQPGMPDPINCYPEEPTTVIEVGWPNRQAGQAGWPNRVGGQAGWPNWQAGRAGWPNWVGGQAGWPNWQAGQGGWRNWAGGQAGWPNWQAGRGGWPNWVGGQAGWPNWQAGQGGWPNWQAGQAGWWGVPDPINCYPEEPAPESFADFSHFSQIGQAQAGWPNQQAGRAGWSGMPDPINCYPEEPSPEEAGSSSRYPRRDIFFPTRSSQPFKNPIISRTHLKEPPKPPNSISIKPQYQLPAFRKVMSKLALRRGVRIDPLTGSIKITKRRTHADLQKRD